MTKTVRTVTAKKEPVKKREKKISEGNVETHVAPILVAESSKADNVVAENSTVSQSSVEKKIENKEHLHSDSVQAEPSQLPVEKKEEIKKENNSDSLHTAEKQGHDKQQQSVPRNQVQASDASKSQSDNNSDQQRQQQNIDNRQSSSNSDSQYQGQGQRPSQRYQSHSSAHQQRDNQNNQNNNNQRKFVKRSPHAGQGPHRNPHPQSSHYAQNNQQNNDNRGQDGYYKQKEDVPLKSVTREQLEEMAVADLCIYAKRYGVIGAVLMSHKTLVEKILEMQQDPDREILVEGVLEKLPDGFGFLRSARFDYVSSPDDVYVSPAQIRKMGLRTGDTIAGTIRRPKENEKYLALSRIDKVNFSDPEKLHERPHFDRLSPMHPNKKFTLEYLPHYVSTRIMDIFTPVGKGQRGLVVAPPKAGKTVLSKEIAQSLIANHPEVFLIMLLIDERPEEVADMKRFVKGAHAEVISSTFDEPAERHVQVAEIVLEKAKRLVEVGKDVVIFLDSVTRLARAYNTVAPASGKILTGGVDANSLQRPKRFFGAARCLEEGGSLTILGSALIETGSRMDEVIYEEFKGTGNMEVHLSRKLSNRRIYPSFDLLVSGTRRDDLLQSEEELNRSWVLQKFLANMNTAEAMEFLLDKMKKFKTNEEFFESMNPKKLPNGNGSNGNGNGSNK